MDAQMLADRTQAFAENVRKLIHKMPQTYLIIDDCKQLLRSSGSISANYLEAKEALSKRDFLYRIRISRKESFETRLWLNLIGIHVPVHLYEEHQSLVKECIEFIRIFSAIAKTTQKNMASIANTKIANCK